MGEVNAYDLASRGSSERTGTPAPDPGTASPAARRATRPSWRDPRLAVGVLLVAGAVLVGARVVGAADDTVTVWSAAADLPAGTALTADSLAPAEVRLPDRAVADAYVATASVPPADTVLLRPVGAGELVPRSALGDAGDEGLVEVPVAASVDAVPTTVATGSVVDVWVAPDRTDPSAEVTGPDDAILVLEAVRVLQAPRAEAALGPTSVRRLVVGLPADRTDTLGEVVATLVSGSVVVVRRG